MPSRHFELISRPIPVNNRVDLGRRFMLAQMVSQAQKAESDAADAAARRMQGLDEEDLDEDAEYQRWLVSRWASSGPMDAGLGAGRHDDPFWHEEKAARHVRNLIEADKRDDWEQGDDEDDDEDEDEHASGAAATAAASTKVTVDELDAADAAAGIPQAAAQPDVFRVVDDDMGRESRAGEEDADTSE